MKRVIQITLFLLVLLGLLVGSLAYGDGRSEVNAGGMFSSNDRQITNDYYKRILGNIAPGSIDRYPLRLEIDRNIIPGGRIPKYVERDLQRLPRELESQLSSLKGAYQRFKIGTHVIVLRSDMLITDVIRDAGFKQ